AYLLYTTAGWSCFLLLYAFVAVDVLLFRRRPIPEKQIRLIGLILLVVVTSTLLQKYGAGLRPSPPVGAGGYLGAMAAAFLEGHFGPVGMLLIVAAAGSLGLILCHDALFVWPAGGLLGQIPGWRRPSKSREPEQAPSAERQLMLSEANYSFLAAN